MDAQAMKLKTWQYNAKKGPKRKDLCLSTGFPNVFNMQQALFGRSLLNLNASGDSNRVVVKKVVSKVTVERKVEEVFKRKKHPKDKKGYQANIISLHTLRKPTSADNCAPVLQYWLNRLPTSGLMKFFPFDRESLQPEVEGALTQARTSTEQNNITLIKHIKKLIAGMKQSQHRLLAHNKNIAAKAAEHQTLLDDTVVKITDLSAVLAAVSENLKMSLNTAEETEQGNFNLNGSINGHHPNSSASIMSIPQLSEIDCPQGAKSFFVNHKGVRLTITLSANDETTNGQNMYVQSEDSTESNVKGTSTSVDDSSEEEARQMLIEPILGFASMMTLAASKLEKKIS